MTTITFIFHFLKGCRAVKYNLYQKNWHKYSYEHAVKVRWWVPPGPRSRGGHLHRSNDHALSLLFSRCSKGCRAMKYNLYRKMDNIVMNVVKVRWWVPPGPGSRGGHLHGSDPRPRSRGGGGPPHHQVGAPRVRRHRRGILARRAGLPSPPAPVKFHPFVLSPSLIFVIFSR